MNWADLGQLGEVGVQIGAAGVATLFAVRALVWAQNMTQATMTLTNDSLRTTLADLEERVEAQQHVIDEFRRKESEWVLERAEMTIRIGRLETRLGIPPGEEI